MPVGTPVLEPNNQFGMAWSRYFKIVGDWLLQANKVVAKGPLSYIQQGVIYFVTVQATANLEAELPSPARLPFQADGMTYPAGTKAVPVVTGATYQFWYVGQA